ncbi:MAG: hypothetical protein HZB68_02470 [Candidatus Aenigmarchaeota archaeon]|nr:hypothetical protein [Candidatus Aenigmarchaeota archaeon]
MREPTETIDECLRKARNIAEKTGHMEGVKTYIRFAGATADYAGLEIDPHMVEGIVSKGYANGMKAMISFAKEFAGSGLHKSAEYCAPLAQKYAKEIDKEIGGDMKAVSDAISASERFAPEDEQLLDAFSGYVTSTDHYMEFMGSAETHVSDGAPNKIDVSYNIEGRQKEHLEEFNMQKKLYLYFDSRAAKAVRGETGYGK